MAAIASGLLLGPLALWRVAQLAQTWSDALLPEPAVVLSFALALSAQLGFLVAAVCCATTRSPKNGWH